MSVFTGGCVCGAVRYECDAEPIAMFKCHCYDCRHVSGGAYSAVAYVPLKAFTFIRGDMRYYSTPSGAAGQNKRGFCAVCGSRVTGGESDRGIGILAATLDDTSLFVPQFDIFVADAALWDTLDSQTPKFEGYPHS
jgi:hypothetical protein